MKFFYDFVAGNSRITPFAVPAAALVAWLAVRYGLGIYAGIVFLVLLLATLAGSVLEKER